MEKPLVYYSNNLRGTFNILETMKKYGCTKFVFSSSATVYGIPESVPGCGIVVARHLKHLALARRLIENYRHKVVGYAVGIFAYFAALMSAHGIEVAQKYHSPRAVRRVHLAAKIFYNELCAAVIKEITGKDFKFYEDDMLDMPAIDRIFADNDIEQVIHFAGYKCVPESVEKPLVYYSNNLRGTFTAHFPLHRQCLYRCRVRPQWRIGVRRYP